MLEVVGTLALKYTDGLTKLWPTVVMVISFAASLALCGLALKKIDMSIVYPVWAGLGTMFVAIFGTLLFNEPSNAIKTASIALIVLGVVGLKYSSH